MASIRIHSRSPFLYLRKRDFSGRWTECSTGLRADNKDDVRRAYRLAEKTTLLERRGWNVEHGSGFQSWVPGYIFRRYQFKTIGTKRRVEIGWHTISEFLKLNSIIVPRQVKYHHANDYLTWRIGRRVNLRSAGHNTARLELKFFSLIMNEAVRRGFTETNPFLTMEIPLAPQKKKKALSDSEIEKVRAEIRKEAPWMRIVFETMLYTGCRFNESAIAMDRIDFERKTMTMIDSKRSKTDERRLFTIPLHPELFDLFEQIRDSGADQTVNLTREKNWRFNKFLKTAVRATSHSIRVTFITRCHQSGVSEHQAMRLVNHSSRPIHDIYSRLNAEDVRQVQTQIQIPSANGQSVRPAMPGPI